MNDARVFITESQLFLNVLVVEFQLPPGVAAPTGAKPTRVDRAVALGTAGEVNIHAAHEPRTEPGYRAHASINIPAEAVHAAHILNQTSVEQPERHALDDLELRVALGDADLRLPVAVLAEAAEHDPLPESQDAGVEHARFDVGDMLGVSRGHGGRQAQRRLACLPPAQKVERAVDRAGETRACGDKNREVRERLGLLEFGVAVGAPAVEFGVGFRVRSGAGGGGGA